MSRTHQTHRHLVDRLAAAEAEIQRLQAELAVERLRRSRLEAELSLTRTSADPRFRLAASRP